MFTLKLFQFDKVRIVECDSVTIYRWENGAAQVTAHGPEDAYGIGLPPHPDATETYYDKAIIENAAGKTTEIVTPRPGPQPGVYPDRTRVAKPGSDTGKTLEEWRELLKETDGAGTAHRVETSLKPGEVIR